MSKLLKLKARYYFIMFLVMLVVDVLLCFYTFHQKNNTINIVLLVISFLLTGFIFDMFVNKIFVSKTNKKLFKTKTYTYNGIDYIKEKLSDYTKRNMSYGTIFSKVNDKCLYKITIIDNIKKYHEYDPNNDKGHIQTPGVDKATSMVGLELFVDTDKELLDLIPNYSISNDKMKYSAYYLNNGMIVDPNYLEAVDSLKDDYNNLLKLVGIYEEDNNL